MRVTAAIYFLCFFVADAMALHCPFHLLSEQTSRQGDGVVREYFTRSFQTKDGPYYETLLVYEKKGPGRFRSFSVRRKVHPGLPKRGMETLDLPSHPDSEAAHYAMVAPVVDENIKTYERRRAEDDPHGRGWPTAFIDKLREATKKTINSSVYHWAIDPETGQIVSGVRFTLVPYAFKDGKLVADGPLVRSLFGPVAGYRVDGATHDASGLPLPLAQVPDLAYLGIAVPRPAMPFRDLKGGSDVVSGMHIGIGGLFIDEKLSQGDRDVLNADWMQEAANMAHGTHDPRFNYYFQNFYFMVDPLSEKAYRPWKYSPLTQYTKDGKPVHVADGAKPPKIALEGIDWLPVEWHPERIEEYLADLHEGKVPRKGAAGVARTDHDILFAGPLVPYPFTAEPKAAMDALFARLTNEPAEASSQIYTQLRRKIELLDLHWNELQRGDAATKTRAAHAYELAKRNVVDFLPRLRQLADHPDVEVRRQAFSLLGALMEFPGREGDLLPVQELVREFYPRWILDESSAMRNATAYMLGTYPSLRRLFAKGRTVTAAAALETLEEKGVGADDRAKLESLIRETTAGRKNPQELVQWLGNLRRHADARAIGTAVIDLTLVHGGE